MSEEYEEIRKALIALLCVNDHVYHMFHRNGYNIIRDSYILTIIPDRGIVIQNHATISQTCYFGSMEHYEGRLYIWEGIQIPRKVRMQNMLEMIQSPNTEWE
jgi:hypothetical protein